MPQQALRHKARRSFNCFNIEHPHTTHSHAQNTQLLDRKREQEAGRGIRSQLVERGGAFFFLYIRTTLSFRFSVFAISIPQLRTHAGAVAGSRLVLKKRAREI